MIKLFFGLIFAISSLCYDCSASYAFPRQKFETWFLTYAHHFEKSSMTTCNSTLQRYRNHRSESPIPKFAVAHHADCILANTTETIKANMASAGVVLGLMPSLLSSLGPTLAESSKLVLERPFLSLLLAIGAPAFYPFRAFDDQHPFEALKRPFRTLPHISSSRWPHVLISLLQYLLALAAAVNVVATSLQLGLKTVVTWKKDQSYLPLVWILLPLTIHLCAAIRLLLVMKRVRNHPGHFPQVADVNQQKESLAPSTRTCTSLIHLIIAETRLCAIRERCKYSVGDETFLACVLSALLPVLVVVHLFIGTMIFSSLLFIGVNDTWPVVLRYGVSSLVAQLIRTFEIAGLHCD